MALSLFSLVIFSSFDLFQNGFWTTYNRSFGTIMHVDREFWSSSNILQVEYSYKYYGDLRSGVGLLVQSSPSRLTLWDGANLVVIDKDDVGTKDVNVKPSATDDLFVIDELRFHNSSFEDVVNTLDGKIWRGLIIGSQNFNFNGEVLNEINQKDYTNTAVIGQVPATLPHEVVSLKIERKNLAKMNHQIKAKRRSLELEKSQWVSQKSSSDPYLKNKADEEILRISKLLDSDEFKFKSLTSIDEQIKALSVVPEIKFFGKIYYFKIPPHEMNPEIKIKVVKVYHKKFKHRESRSHVMVHFILDGDIIGQGNSMERFVSY